MILLFYFAVFFSRRFRRYTQITGFDLRKSAPSAGQNKQSMTMHIFFKYSLQGGKKAFTNCKTM